MPATVPLLQVASLEKSYSVPVLNDFSFELESGEVHALVGSNGAGKSTFARILCGLAQADAGSIQLNGKAFSPASKRAAEAAGIVMVLQELNVIGSLTVAENILLNRLPQRGGWIQYARLDEFARTALARVGLAELDPKTPAGSLGVGQQQLIEIAGALARNCRVLILDEPTAALTDPEIERLFGNIRRLQTEGVGVIYISHRMDEIRRIANRVTVLRDGQRISTHCAGEVDPQTLIREMVGHDLPSQNRAGERRTGEVALRVCHLASGTAVRDVSFEVQRGEILGIAGLIGSGRTETLRAIFGADRPQAGEIYVGRPTQAVTINDPTDAVALGIGLVPEDRKRDGLLLSQPVRVNATLTTLTRHARRGWLDLAGENQASTLACKRLNVTCASGEQEVRELSGGNQQKVIIARWLARDCDVLLFDEPTRGIDVAAKDAIYQLLRELSAAGKAIVVVSSDLAELMSLCHRMIVMSAGKVAAEFLPENWSQEKITHAAFSNYLSPKTSS